MRVPVSLAAMLGTPGAAAGGPRIEHVVVLMLENRSFDNVLGFLDHPRADAYDRLWPGRFANPDSAGRLVPVSDDGVAFGPDPDHSHRGALDQIGPAGEVVANGGFVRSYEAVAGPGPGAAAAVMRCLDPARHCPALGTLAAEFAVCTGWFSSVPGETWPNRNFAHAATSGGTVDIEGGLYFDRTIFEVLSKQKGRTWRIYYDGTPQVWCYPRLWRPTTFLDFLLRRRSRIGNWFESAQFADHVATWPPTASSSPPTTASTAPTAAPGAPTASTPGTTSKTTPTSAPATP